MDISRFCLHQTPLLLTRSINPSLNVRKYNVYSSLETAEVHTLGLALENKVTIKMSKVISHKDSSKLLNQG